MDVFKYQLKEQTELWEATKCTHRIRGSQEDWSTKRLIRKTDTGDACGALSVLGPRLWGRQETWLSSPEAWVLPGGEALSFDQGEEAMELTMRRALQCQVQQRRGPETCRRFFHESLAELLLQMHWRRLPNMWQHLLGGKEEVSEGMQCWGALEFWPSHWADTLESCT